VLIRADIFLAELDWFIDILWQTDDRAICCATSGCQFVALQYIENYLLSKENLSSSIDRFLIYMEYPDSAFCSSSHKYSPLASN
jgi:hypothetical protein